jgi:hypothetical protein
MSIVAKGSFELEPIKKTEEELLAMTNSELAYYISEIVQTDLCKDKRYCERILKVFLDKK